MKKNEQKHDPDQGWCYQKWFLRMRILFIILVICSFQLSAMESSLAQKVSIKLSNADLKAVIEAIEEQTRLGFLYNEQEITAIRNLNIDAKEKEVKLILDQILAGSPLTYRIENQTILISSKTIAALPQEIKTWVIKGKVTDSKKNLLPGVSVCIKGTSMGVATNDKGEYILEIPATKGTMLTYSFIGMKVKEATVNDSRTVDVVLEDDCADLDEVTVVAYGERKKREMISAISSVKAKDLEEIPSSSFENLLQGHMAGVEITNIAGSPGGGGTRVNVRGYNSLLIDGINDGSPLYVIDGVPVNSFTSPVTGTNTLAEIDPSTIESVEVLKDAASAAIYGSRASNGVILITTKQGQVGKGKFSANISYSYSILPETPVQISGNAERQWWLLTGRNQVTAYQDPRTYQYILPSSYQELYNKGNGNGVYDYFWNGGYIVSRTNQPMDVYRALQDSLNPFYNNSTNWWKYTFRSGKILNANIQASGGTERVKYMVGAGWYDESGIMLGSDFKRANIISNLSITPRKNLQLDARLYLSYTDRSTGAASAGLSSGTKIEGMTVNPVSTSTLYPGEGEVHDQLIKALNQSAEKNYSYTIRANFGLSYEILKGLKLRSTLAADYNFSKRNSFRSAILDVSNNLAVSQGQMAGNMNFQNEDLLYYNFTLNENHNFDLLAGFSYTRKATDMMGGSGKGSPSDKIHYVPTGFDDLGTNASGNTIALQSYTSDFQEQLMLSYFGRVAYNYRQKYLMEFTFRRDGSSTFGEKHRWANFPSIAVGWTFSEENFMKDLWWLSYGKLRGSWGTSGQTFADSYLAHGTLGVGNSFLGNTGMKATSILSDQLTWEKSDQYDIGLDMDFLDYRLKFKLDYYYKYSKSLLYQTSLPGNVYGLEKSWQNAMEISNEGLELEATFDIFRESAVSWRARFNISRNWNRFEKSYTGMDITGSGSNYVIGRPIFGLYVYKAGKIAQTEDDIPKYWTENGQYTALNFGSAAYPFRPGMRLIEDLNGDGKITSDDAYYAGSSLPLAYGGFANEIKWKGFDLNILFTYSIGRKLINVKKNTSLSFDGMFSTIYSDYRDMDFWQQSGNDTDTPSLEATGSAYIGQFSGFTDRMIETVNWLRLKQLTLGYTVPESITQKIGIEGIRAFFTAENLFILHNYSGIDPEAVDPTNPYDNMNKYPLARKLTLGLTLNF